MIPIAGIRQITTGQGVCANPFTLTPNSSCVLHLDALGSTLPPNGVHQGPVVCKVKTGNYPDPFLCSQAAANNQLNVTLINQPLPTSSIATIVNFASRTVSICIANKDSGLLESCTNTDPFSTEIAVLTISKDGKYAYLSGGESKSVTVCNHDVSDGALSNCKINQLNFGSIFGIALNPGNTKLYLGAEPVVVCDRNQTSGVFSGCKPAGPTISKPVGIAFNDSFTKAYIGVLEENSDAGTEVAVCNVNQNTGMLFNCTFIPGFNGPAGIVLNIAKSKAYIANAGNDFTGNQISVCDIQPTGLLSNCTRIGGLVSPIYIALNPQATKAYVSNFNADFVSVCDILGNGNLANCIQAGNGFNKPAGISIN